MTKIKAYIFSGLGSSFIPSFKNGTDKIAHRLKILGVDVETHVWNKWESVYDDILNNFDDNQKIVLIGHSNGVLACANIAHRLNIHGIKVHYLAAIDPTLVLFSKILDNVQYVDEFWAKYSFIHFVRRVSGFQKGVVQYRTYNNTIIKPKPVTLKTTHVSIASNKKVLDAIEHSVVGLFNR